MLSGDVELGMLGPQEAIAALQHCLDHCPEKENTIFLYILYFLYFFMPKKNSQISVLPAQIKITISGFGAPC